MTQDRLAIKLIHEMVEELKVTRRDGGAQRKSVISAGETFISKYMTMVSFKLKCMGSGCNYENNFVAIEMLDIQEHKYTKAFINKNYMTRKCQKCKKETDQLITQMTLEGDRS